MFFKRNKPDYQQLIQWQYPERPVLKAWAVKARNYDIRPMGAFFAATIFIFLGVSALLYYMILKGDVSWKIDKEAFSYAAGTFLFVFPFMYAWTLGRKKLCVYRATTQGLELCTWHDIEKWKTIVLVVGILMIVVIIAAASVYPGALMALFVGPPIMGWFYYSMFTRSDYWEMQQDLFKKELDWNEPEIESLSIFCKRRIITIFINNDIENLYKYGTDKYHIFCPKDQFEELVAFFKQQLPNVPCQEGRVFISPHAC